MLWVGSKLRSSRILTTQHQALLGCLPHRLFVSLAQVNQLLDALLGLQEKGQGDEFWLSGLEQEHSQLEGSTRHCSPMVQKSPSSSLFSSSFSFFLCPCLLLQHIWGISSSCLPRAGGCAGVSRVTGHMGFLFFWSMQPCCLLPTSLTFKQPSAAHPATRVCTSSSSSCSRKHTRAWGRWRSQCHHL